MIIHQCKDDPPLDRQFKVITITDQSKPDFAVSSRLKYSGLEIIKSKIIMIIIRIKTPSSNLNKTIHKIHGYKISIPLIIHLENKSALTHPFQVQHSLPDKIIGRSMKGINLISGCRMKGPFPFRQMHLSIRISKQRNHISKF